MKALISFCFATLAATISLAQSQPTMLSQSRYRIETDGKPKLQDSVTHTHSAGRVSYGLPEISPNDGVYRADESIRVYKSASFASFLPADKMTRAFNAAGQISEYREQIKPGALYKEVYKEWYHYNTDMLLDTQWATDYNQTRRLVYTYQNNIRRSKLQQLQTTVLPQAWAVEGIDSFIANGTDSFYLRYWDMGMGMQLFERHHYLRDANLKVVADSFLGQSNILNSLTRTSYDAAGRKAEDSVFTGPTANFDHKTTYRYDSNGNLVSKTAYSGNIIRDTMTYNAVNQLTSVETHALVNNTWFPHPGSFWRYYYYGFPTGISDVAEGKTLRLYPVPATSYINIDVNFAKPEKFSVRILDMQGRIVRAWDEAAQASYKEKIQLDGMPAGNYIINVLSENNNITRQFSMLQ